MRRIRHGGGALGRPTRHFPRQRVGNPLFPRHAAGAGQVFSKRTAIGGLLALTIAIAAWYLIWSPAFRIKDIAVSGASPAVEQPLRDLLGRYLTGRQFLVLPRDNVFFFNKDAAQREIGRSFFLDELKLELKMPGKLTVRLKERSLKAVLLTAGRFLALDQSGMVLRELAPREIETLGDLPPDLGAAQVQELDAAETAPPTDAPAAKPPAEPAKKTAPPPAAKPTPAPATDKENTNRFPLIVAGRSEGQVPAPPPDLKPGETAFPEAVISLILQANARLPDLAGSRVRWYAVSGSAETVEATMGGDWVVRLTTLIPFDVQGNRLSLVLKEKIGGQKDQLEYVDLRYNERIFFRLKQAENASAPAK